MKLKRLIKWGIGLVLVVTSILGSFLLYKYFTNKAPVEDLTLARVTLADVKKQLVGEFSNEEYNKAQGLYNKAMEDWQLQNEKFFVFRDYTNTRDLAFRSVTAALKAKVEGGAFKEKITQNLVNELLKTGNLIETFEKYYKCLPLQKTILNQYSSGKMKYFEAVHHSEKGEIKKALSIVLQAKESLLKADRSAFFNLQEFYNGYPEWKKNYELAYSLSKKQTVILVNKMEGICTVLKSGKEYKTYTAEFGKNWMGDKMKSGDDSTPEGVYKVLEKKQGVKTKYYKALLLNYPNKADEVRFERLKRTGVIGKNDKIGGLIEIHGGGERGINWTNGCVALSNESMDAVYAKCSINTPVIIIGATNSLEEYLNSK
jgi:hypothetical protein